MKPKEWFTNKYSLELTFKHEDEPEHVVFQTKYLANAVLPEYFLGRARTLCRRAGIDLVTAVYNGETRGQVDTWAALVARVIAQDGYQSMKQLNEEIDNLVLRDIRIFKEKNHGGKH